MKKYLILFFLYFFLWINLSYALDWKKLHEKADKENASSAVDAVKSAPGSIDNLYVLGLVYLNEHRDKEAGGIFDRILVLEPDTVEALWGKAEVLRRQHELHKSEDLLNRVSAVSPGFSPATITLAYIRYIQFRFNEAVRLAIKVLDQGEKVVDKSNHVRAHLIYGGTKGMIAHYGGWVSKIVNGPAVMPSLKAAEKLQPDAAGVKFGLGSFYLLAPVAIGGDLRKAEEYLKKTIEIDPLFCDAYVRLAQLYKIKGDNAKYDEYIKKALEIDPDNELALDVSSGRCKFICFDKRSQEY